MAFQDPYFSPEVVGIITQGYTGQVGSLIMVQAVDDFKVNSVKVQIYSAGDEIVEEGPAVAAGEGLNWNYTATTLNENVAGGKVAGGRC